MKLSGSNVLVGSSPPQCWLLLFLDNLILRSPAGVQFLASRGILLSWEMRTQRTFLVVQCLRIRLPMQGTWVRSSVWENPTYRGANKPMRHNYWACALEPTSHNYWAHVPQLLKFACLEPVLHSKRSPCNEKPTHRNEEVPLPSATREKPTRSNEDPMQPKINK